MFPLGTVLMPGMPLPLHIFEPRYRQLTVDLVTSTVPGKEFGVIAVREGWTPDRDGIHGLHRVGCTAELRDVRKLADGRFDIVTPMSGAWALHRAWPEAKLDIIPDAGHASTEPGIVDSLIRAMDWAAKL